MNNMFQKNMEFYIDGQIRNNADSFISIVKNETERNGKESLLKGNNSLSKCQEFDGDQIVIM